MFFLFKQVILRSQPFFFQGVIYREQADWKGTHYLKGFDININKPPFCSLELGGFLPSFCFKVHLRSKTSPLKVSSCKFLVLPVRRLHARPRGLFIVRWKVKSAKAWVPWRELIKQTGADPKKDVCKNVGKKSHTLRILNPTNGRVNEPV